MNIDMNGKAVKAIFFTGPEGGEIKATEDKKLHLSATYHGDRDEFWVVVMDCGKEIQRFNCRHLEGIEWADQEEE